MRIYSLHGEHLTLYCEDLGHTHRWTIGYIDVDKKDGKHIMDRFLNTGNVGSSQEDIEPVVVDEILEELNNG